MPASVLYESNRACTVVVRLDYESFEALGYRIICRALAAEKINGTL